MKFAALNIILGILLLQVCVNAEEPDQPEGAAPPGDAPEPTRLPKGPDASSTFPPIIHSTNIPQQKNPESPAATSVPKETTTPAPGSCSHILGSVMLIFISGIFHFL